MMTMIHGIIKGFCLMGCLSFGGVLPDDANPRAIAHALEAMRKSIDTYMPFDISFDRPSENNILFDTSIIPQQPYDFLYVIANARLQTYHLIWLEKQKLHIREYRDTSVKIVNVINKTYSLNPAEKQPVPARKPDKPRVYDKSDWCFDLTKKNAEALICLMKQYKASNSQHEQLSEKSIARIRRLGDMPDIYVMYGLDSHLFGIVFGSTVLPEDHMSRLFQLLFEYVWEVRIEYRQEKDVDVNKLLADGLQKMEVARSLEQQAREGNISAFSGSVPALIQDELFTVF